MQFLKIFEPPIIDVPSAKITSVNVSVENAPSPIDVTLPGIVKWVIATLLNAL